MGPWLPLPKSEDLQSTYVRCFLSRGSTLQYRFSERRENRLLYYSGPSLAEVLAAHALGLSVLIGGERVHWVIAIARSEPTVRTLMQ